MHPTPNPFHCTHCASLGLNCISHHRFSRAVESVREQQPVLSSGQTDGTILCSRLRNQLHSESDGAAGPVWARLLPDTCIAGLAPSHRLKAADNSGH